MFAATVNGAWLLVLSLLVVAAAINRLRTVTQEVRALPVLIVSAVAALVMLTGALILGGDEDDSDDLHMRAVILDTAGDAASAAGVAVVGAIILATGGWYWLDSTIAVVVSAVLAYHATKLLVAVRAKTKSTR